MHPRLERRFPPARRLHDHAHGTVWLTEDPRGPLAIKVPTDAAGRARIRAEAAVLRKVQHPALVELVEADPEGSYLATRFIPGPDAATWAKGRPIAPVIELCARIAEGLAALHALGIAHGDLKPANIRVGPDDQPVLIDLGLGTMEGPGFRGTPGYAAPEQLRGEPPRPESDAYALGVLLFHLLTGGHPFTRDLCAQALAPSQRLGWTPAMARAEIPAAVDNLVARLLHRHPRARPGDLQAVAATLRAASSGTPARLHPAVLACWRPVGRWLVRAQDIDDGGILVLHGPAGRPRRQLLEILVRAARIEGLPIVDLHTSPALSASARRAMVLADGDSGAALRLFREQRARLVLTTPHPLPRLVERGAVHVQLMPEQAPQSPASRARLSQEPQARRILDALEPGPLEVEELARRLGMGALDLLDLAEPLLDAGLLAEAEEGRALSRP